MPTRNAKGQFLPGTSGNPGGVPRARTDADSTALTVTAPPFLDQFREPRRDGWTSAITGIGDITRDKRTTHTLGRLCLSYEMIARLWESEAMAAKAIEKPGEECFRPGFDLDLPPKLKDLVKDRLRELDVVPKIKKAHQYKRAYGGGAMLLGVDDGRRLDEPLDMSRARSLDWINVLEPIEIYPVSFYDDPAKAQYNEPEFYQLGAYAGLPTDYGSPKPVPELNAIIHESRIIPFRGIQASRYFFNNNIIDPYWGASLLPRFYEAMRDCAVAYSGAGLLTVDVSQPVITIDGLKGLVGKNEELLRARMVALEMGRSIARALLLDSKEKYERQTTQLAGIPDLLDRCAQFLAANIDIPLSILFGYSPASLGTPDNQELTQWYNICRVLQTQEFTPPLRRIIDLILRSERQRGLPKRYEITWGDLEHMTTTQMVQNNFTQARADSLQIKSGTAYPDEIRNSRWKSGQSYRTQIDETKKAPGFAAPPPTGVGGVPPANGNVPGNAGHVVTGYTRRNPARSGTEPNPGTGSEQPEGRPHRADGRGGGRADAGYTAADEVAYLQDRVERLRKDGALTPAMEAMMGKLIALTQAEADRCAAGTCGPDCIYAHADVAAGETITFAGFPVLVENPKGSVRHWIDSDGTAGETTMKWDYGEIPGSLGTDGDPVDVYLGPNPDSKWVFVIHQMCKSTGFTTADEDKVMIGWDTAAAATRAYLSQYDDERFFGGMSQMTVDDFRAKVMTRAGERIANDGGEDGEGEDLEGDDAGRGSSE